MNAAKGAFPNQIHAFLFCRKRILSRTMSLDSDHCSGYLNNDIKVRVGRH